MAKRLSVEAWEDAFVKICEEKLEEEPLYEYIHLYQKGLTPEQAFVAYVKENPDYEEKVTEVLAEQKEATLATLSPAERQAREAQEKVREEARQRLSRYCPDCARDMGGKKLCKCGYRREKSPR
jgi:hypothetical protein